MASEIIIKRRVDFRSKNVGGESTESESEVDEAGAVVFGHPAGCEKGSFEGVEPVVKG